MDQWPKAAVTHLSKARQEAYRNNESAVRALRDTKGTVETVAEAHDLSPDELYRLIERATSIHPRDKKIWGFRALVPYTQVDGYRREKELPRKSAATRKEKAGYAGAFSAFLAEHPSLKDFIHTNVFREGPDGKLIRKLSIPKLHRRFVNQVQQADIPSSAYPLNQTEKGRRSLYQYVRELESKHLERTLHFSESAEVAALYSRRTVDGQQLYAIRPYEIVQADGHELKLDVALTIKRPDGTTLKLVVPRMWLIVFFDLYSRAILGYVLVAYENYSSYDVLSATAAALYGRTERFPMIEGSRYPGKSLPVEFEPALTGVCWDILSFDNALAHTAKDVVQKLLGVVNCAVCRGLPAVPEFRAFIERAFKTIQERGGLEQLAASRKNARADHKDAVALENIVPLIDGLVWEYNFENATEGNYGRLPYEALLDALEDPLLRKVGSDRWGRSHLMTRRVVKAVCGNVKESRPPYIEWAHARYGGRPLLDDPDLIGQDVIFEYDEDDVLWATIYSMEGAELGRLKAQGNKWGRKSHSLRLRRLIWEQIRLGLLKVPEGVDFITAWQQEQLRKKKPLPSRARAAMAERSMRGTDAEGSASGKTPPPPQPPKLTTARPSFKPVDPKRKTYS